MPKIENCPFCGANMELLYFQRWMNDNELVVGAYWQCSECKARSGDYYGSDQREAEKKATDALVNRSDSDFHKYVSKIIEESEV